MCDGAYLCVFVYFPPRHNTKLYIIYIMRLLEIPPCDNYMGYDFGHNFAIKMAPCDAKFPSFICPATLLGRRTPTHSTIAPPNKSTRQPRPTATPKYLCRFYITNPPAPRRILTIKPQKKQDARALFHLINFNF